MSRDPSQTTELDANGKLNASLRVIGRRADGYHELETLVLPLALADRVRVTVFDRLADASERFGIDDVTGPPEIVSRVPAGEMNLMVRAAEAFARLIGSDRCVRMSVSKRIPVGGGLGGGSADAAAVLRALNQLFEAGLSGEALSEIGAAIGSDVPALLAGGAVLARGRGERIQRVTAAPFRWLIARFVAGVPTADAFGWWDADVGSAAGAWVRTQDPESGIANAAGGGDPAVLGPSLSNDLEPPVFRRRPDVAEAKRLLLAAGLPGAVMCGSGASVAGLLPDGVLDEDLDDLRRSLERLTGLPPSSTASLDT